MTYCCAMRERFLIGIIAENPALPMPTDAVDMMDFEEKDSLGRPVIRIRFCPFCGKAATGPLRIAKEEAE